MNDRRTSTRHMIDLNVTLYHDAIGLIKGKIQDISSGGMFVGIRNTTVLNKKLSQELLTVKPANMDVLFNMQCLRVGSNSISLKFIE